MCVCYRYMVVFLMSSLWKPAFSICHLPHLWSPRGHGLRSWNAHFRAPLPISIRCSLQTLPAGNKNKKRVVFLGTPKVAADVLHSLLDSAQAMDSIFEVAAIVTQPPTVRGRGQKLLPSPVAQLAMDRNFATTYIMWPHKAGEERFLAEMKELQPDLCVTAAYGNILPKRFLDIPLKGTVNIHPSLLPLYRGAAPVQRALQDGVRVTGVTVAYTVRAMDAGPIITSERMELNDSIKAPELLALLFERGTFLLLKELPSILDGSAAEKAREQNHSCATHAPKVSVDEAWLDFEEPANVLHNKVRAFADWPGTKARFELLSSSGDVQELVLKIITTNAQNDVVIEGNAKQDVVLSGSSLVVHCGAGSALEILELQPPGKRVMSARDFFNGLRGQQLKKI